MARSIIIEDIKPTHWRLRLRDGAGKSREVDFKSGTPLRLDMSEKVAVIDSAAKKSHKPTKPEAQAPAKSKDTARTPDKGRKRDEEPEADKGRKREQAPEAERPRSDSDAAAPKPAAEPTSKPRRHKPEPGAGPGELVWEENEDDGVPGLWAGFERGAFKILHAGGDVFALFYEWNNGKYQTLACGSLESLKEAAAQWQGDNKLQAPRSNLGAEAAKVACAKPEEPQSKAPQPAAPVIEPEKDKAIMEGFEATLQKIMAARAAAKEGT